MSLRLFVENIFSSSASSWFCLMWYCSFLRLVNISLQSLQPCDPWLLFWWIFRASLSRHTLKQMVQVLSSSSEISFSLLIKSEKVTTELFSKDLNSWRQNLHFRWKVKCKIWCSSTSSEHLSHDNGMPEYGVTKWKEFSSVAIRVKWCSWELKVLRRCNLCSLHW